MFIKKNAGLRFGLEFTTAISIVTLLVAGCSQPAEQIDTTDAADETTATVDTMQEAPEQAPEQINEPPVVEPGGGPEVVEELMITDVEVGDGATAEKGKNVIVHYTGWLYDPSQPGNKGNKFDSSVDRGQPFVFPLGAGRVIQGWDQGFDGMQIGGKRVLIIPPDMGYGERGSPPVIPPSATLLFEVELLGVQ